METKLCKVREKVRQTILRMLSEYNLPANILVEEVQMKRGQISLQTFPDKRCIIVMMHKEIIEDSFWVRQEIAREITEGCSNYRFEGNLEQHKVYLFV